MSEITFTLGPTPVTVRAADGKVLTAPAGWVLLPPGDAALTRRVKAAGDHWAVQEKKGRKIFSRGVWAPAATIDRILAELVAERSTESFAKRKEALRIIFRTNSATYDRWTDLSGNLAAIFVSRPKSVALPLIRLWFAAFGYDDRLMN